MSLQHLETVAYRFTSPDDIKMTFYQGGEEMRKLLIAWVLVCGGALGVVTGAHATGADADAVALCVGCTTPAQFQAAAMQALGTRFNGTRTVLVVNPDSALSKWVLVTNAPPGQEPLSVTSPSPVQTGEPVALEPHPFANIYVAGDGQPSMQGTSGSESVRSWKLTQTENAGVETIQRLTEKTIVVQLDPTKFPSYEGSIPGLIANANYTALQMAEPGWPVTSFSERVLDDLKKLLGEYYGHAFKVCDVSQMAIPCAPFLTHSTGMYMYKQGRRRMKFRRIFPTSVTEPQVAAAMECWLHMNRVPTWHLVRRAALVRQEKAGWSAATLVVS